MEKRTTHADLVRATTTAMDASEQGDLATPNPVFPQDGV